MTRRVRVLCSERRSKRVDVAPSKIAGT
jgi:hypothetical protein